MKGDESKNWRLWLEILQIKADTSTSSLAIAIVQDIHHAEEALQIEAKNQTCSSGFLIIRDVIHYVHDYESISILMRSDRFKSSQLIYYILSRYCNHTRHTSCGGLEHMTNHWSPLKFEGKNQTSSSGFLIIWDVIHDLQDYESNHYLDA